MSGEDAGNEDDLDWLGGLEDEEELDDSWLDEITGMDESEEQLQMAGGEEVEASAALAAADDEVPEDLDEAMAWLEQLAARQGAPVDELPSLDEFSVPGETSVSAMDELEDIPDDPEEALAWLEALAEGETGVEAATEAGAEIEVVDEPSTPAVPHDVVAARAEAEAILLHDEMDAAAEPSEDEIFADIPEDPDEAMAWLEQLAARQGAPLDELPSVSEPVEEVETPDWIAREAEAETGAEAETVLPVAEADEEAWVEDESEDLLDELTAELELEDEQLGEAMPDWLGLDDEDAGAVDAIDWNDIEGDVAGWLEAEEEATQHEMVIPAVTAEMDELAPDESDSSEAVWAESAQVAPVAEEAPATEWQQPHIENERLLSARQAVEAGDFDSAVTAYNELLEASEDLNLLISELEGAVGAQRENSRLRTVLGDAYMRNGQLQKALDAYRQALDSL